MSHGSLLRRPIRTAPARGARVPATARDVCGPRQVLDSQADKGASRRRAAPGSQWVVVAAKRRRHVAALFEAAACARETPGGAKRALCSRRRTIGAREPRPWELGGSPRHCATAQRLRSRCSPPPASARSAHASRAFGYPWGSRTRRMCLCLHRPQVQPRHANAPLACSHALIDRRPGEGVAWTAFCRAVIAWH